MRLGEGDRITLYQIFLSSGDDARDLRDRVDGLVYRAINPQLRQTGVPVRFEVDRWERSAAQRTPDGETTNHQFVQRARAANLTLALLLDSLGNGTREELEAVLADQSELSALWFVPKEHEPDSEVAGWLSRQIEALYYDKVGLPGDPESWEGIMRVLVRALIQALTREPEDYDERR